MWFEYFQQVEIVLLKIFLLPSARENGHTDIGAFADIGAFRDKVSSENTVKSLRAYPLLIKFRTLYRTLGDDHRIGEHCAGGCGKNSRHDGVHAPVMFPIGTRIGRVRMR